MKRLLSVAVTACLLATVGACGNSDDSSDGPITLSFLSYNYGTPDVGGEGTQQLIDAFEKSHPDITIAPQGVPVADTLTRVRSRTAAGDPPDVAQIGWSKVAAAYRGLPLTPVQDIPTADEWRSATAGLSQPLLRAVEHEGKVAAMPYTLSTPTLFYNADLFRKAGLDPAKPPATIAEAQRAGLALVRIGASGVYFDIAGASKSDFLTQSVVAANGGSVATPDGRVTFDQPAAVEALTAVQQLTTSGAQPAVAEADAIAAFKAGKLGALVTSTALLAGLEEAANGHFELRTGGMPGFAGKPVRTTFSGAGLVVLAKDDAHKQAAWEFIKFLTSAEGYTIITSKIGYLPLRPDLVKDPRYLGPYFAKDPRIGPALDQLETVRPYTFFDGPQADRAVATLQDDAVAPIVLRGADPASTLAEVAAQVRSMTGR
ncbi:ABC transporter substrate-binding protein [Cryptosporangium phraense]|uniref:ABC transporter substrate-binding protein n=1 Tax=Cryptosporangium phraense TaxID=2593070 RepID=UPI00197AE2BC|nr:ABC transporter substrate-binding protein [Cryptosporangium phraense]